MVFLTENTALSIIFSYFAIAKKQNQSFCLPIQNIILHFSHKSGALQSFFRLIRILFNHHPLHLREQNTPLKRFRKKPQTFSQPPGGQILLQYPQHFSLPLHHSNGDATLTRDRRSGHA